MYRLRRLLAAAPLLLLATPAAARVLAAHDGASDPEDEGWSSTITGTVSVGPVLDDLGLGLDAWSVDDDDNSGLGAYSIFPSAGDLTDASENGWTLSARVRIVRFPDPPVGQERPLAEDGSPTILFREGTRDWSIHFGAQADGDVIAMLMTKVTPAGSREGTPIVISGGTSEYRRFKMVHDPVSDTAELFVDGVSVATGYEGAPNVASTQIAFGAGTTPAQGHAHFNSVRFSTPTMVPSLPTLARGSLFLLVVGSGWLFLARRLSGDARAARTKEP